MGSLVKEPESKSISGTPSTSVEAISHSLGSRVGAVASNVSEKAADYVTTTREYVKDHPLQSVFIAAAGGVILGSLATIVSRSKH